MFPQAENHRIRSSHQDSHHAYTSRLVCAYVEFDSEQTNPLFEALPRFVIAKANSYKESVWLKNLLELLFSGTHHEMPAFESVIQRLNDFLLIHIIRSYFADCPSSHGIVAAFNDPGLRPVLELIHDNPQKPWSVADFCKIANMSRSAFIDKFSNTLKMPPMNYLTRLRLQYAYRQLREGRNSIIDIALDCGYENASSFSKAFKKMYDIGPGSFKKSYAGVA